MKIAYPEKCFDKLGWKKTVDKDEFSRQLEYSVHKDNLYLSVSFELINDPLIQKKVVNVKFELFINNEPFRNGTEIEFGNYGDIHAFVRILNLKP